MNLLLHGLEAPQISSDNSLKVKVTEIGDRERVDVILTNPPFGGEEERGILGNYPDDKQTAETALLYCKAPKPQNANARVRDRLQAMPFTGRSSISTSRIPPQNRISSICRRSS